MGVGINELASVVGGFATLAGVAIAIPAAIAALLQARSQHKIYAEQEYSNVLSTYVEEREKLRELIKDADFDADKPETFSAAKVSITLIVRYLSVLYHLNMRSRIATSPADWVLFGDDIDYIELVMRRLARRMQITSARDYVDHAEVVAKRKGDEKAIIQLSAIKDAVDKIVGDETLSDSDRAAKISNLMENNGELINSLTGGVASFSGDEGDYALFMQRNRQEQQLAILTSEFSELNRIIHAQSQKMYAAATTVKRKRSVSQWFSERKNA